DLRRLVASLAVMGWQKALPEETLRHLGREFLHAYVSQVQHYVEGMDDEEFAVRLDTTTGTIHHVLQQARMSTRVGMLDSLSSVQDYERLFTERAGVGRLNTSREDSAHDIV